MMHRFALALLLPLFLVSCGGSSGGGGGSEPRSGKDRGSAAMSIGGVAWEATRAKASLKGKSLMIRASRMEMSGGAAKRQELHLQIADFDGLGEYVAGRMGSRFLGVGIRTDAMEAAGDDDDAVSKQAIEALQKASHMTLGGAKVTVTSVDDEQIVGTFSWQAPKGLDKPSLEGGSFRALRQ